MHLEPEFRLEVLENTVDLKAVKISFQMSFEDSNGPSELGMS